MKRIDNKIGSLATALVVALGLGWGAGVAGPAVAPLDQAERDGYAQWLHSLQQAVSAREAAGQPEGNLLYPFDTPGWKADPDRPFRHLAISKAVTETEARFAGPSRKRLTSALAALSQARNYANLSEYDSALVWYRSAAVLDTVGSFRREIARESLAAAAAGGDSLKAAQLVTNTLGLSDLTGRDLELILAYRWLLSQQDAHGLELLTAKVETLGDALSDRLGFWHAFALTWLDEPVSGLAELRGLIRSGGLSRGLSEAQRSWVLTALPDLLFRLGEIDTARELYDSLKASRVESLRLWGTYQLANLDLLAAAYLKAGDGYDTVCQARRLGSWQDQACAMKDIARELERIQAEGQRHGVAAHSAR